MSRCTSGGRGIVVMPRDHASWSTDSRVMPRRSYLWATMDFPDPAGPHMKITRPMRVHSRHKVTHSGFLAPAGINIAVN